MRRAVSAMLAGLAVLSVPLFAAAQEQESGPSDADRVMAACLATKADQANPERACIGAIFSACPGSAGSTQDMVECIDAEVDYWDLRLNASYRAHYKALVAEDADESPYDGLSLAEQFRAAQRSWIGYRDANCTFARNQHRGGSLGRLSGLMCMMTMTAERVLEIEGLIEGRSI
jgi:uncharacterized protein YecT (DUF1311 family)